jgi:hypothetical protein
MDHTDTLTFVLDVPGFRAVYAVGPAESDLHLAGDPKALDPYAYSDWAAETIGLLCQQGHPAADEPYEAVDHMIGAFWGALNSGPA